MRLKFSDLKVGMWVTTRTGVAQITRVGKYGGAPGCWFPNPTGDPGTNRGAYPSFCADWCVTPAIVGTTVCETPRFGGCRCGLHHVLEGELSAMGYGKSLGVGIETITPVGGVL